MSPPHSYTIDDDGDDSDICPVCDGECTCHPPTHAAPRPPPPTPKPGVPLSMAELSLMYAAGSSSRSSSSSGPPYPSSSAPTSTPSTSSSTSTSKPSLKIKLTVPPSLLAKRRQSQPPHAAKSYKNHAETTSDYANAGYTSASDPPASSAPVSTAPAPKKRGRPPKSLARQNQQHTSTLYASARSPPYKPLNPKTAAPGKHPKSIKARPSQTHNNHIKPRPGALSHPHARKKPVKKKRVLQSDDETSSLSSDSDVAMALAGPHVLHRKNVNAGAAPTVMAVADLPTFVSASALSSSLSSTNSSSSSSSLSEFDSDSDIEAEEESFILADVHDKARVKRELLGGGEKRNGGRNNDWVIRPRKKSVGPSDVEMDVDSDATEEDDDEDEDEDEADADNDEADAEGEDEDEETEEDVTLGSSAAQMQLAQMQMQMMQDEEEGESTDDHRHRYVGLATGWSEEEDESSFDADLFFANLSDTDSISSKSSSGTAGFNSAPRNGFSHAHSPFASSMGEEGDQSDISCAASDFTERGFGAAGGDNALKRLKPFEALPFEVTQGWDGQIVFTNGTGETQNSTLSMVDFDFEADASRFASSSATNSVYGDDSLSQHAYFAPYADMQQQGDSDVEMFTHSEGGYEEEDGELEGSGDTTDEELVGEDDLPNERAMRLFSLPLSVSAINPLSTVSSPGISPGLGRGLGRGGVEGRGRGRKEKRKRGLVGMWGAGAGPSALDILQGRVVFYDSDEAIFDESSEESSSEEDSDDDEEGDSDEEMGSEEEEDEDMIALGFSSSASELEAMSPSELEEYEYDGGAYGYECDERMIKAMTNKLSRRMMKKRKDSANVGASASVTAGWDENLAGAGVVDEGMGVGTPGGGGKNIHVINKHNAMARKMALAAAAAKNTNGSAKRRKAKGVDKAAGAESATMHSVESVRSVVKKMKNKEKKNKKKRKKTPTGPRQGVFSPSRETRQAVIGDDVKGADVPSPHPRFMGRRRAPRTPAVGDIGMGSAVEHLLRRHLHTLSASISSTGSIADAPPPSVSSASTPAAGGVGVLANDPHDPSSPAATTDERSPLELLLSSVAAVAAANSDMQDDQAVIGAGDAGVVGDAVQEQDVAKPIQLDDVLDASFLDDPEDTRKSAADAGASNVENDSGANGEASSPGGQEHQQQDGQDHQSSGQHQQHQEENVHVHKNLARWDMISVGAFRQTRESGWGGFGMGMGMGMGGMHTPHSSADYGNVIKSSPFSSGRLGLGLGFGALAAGSGAGGSGSAGSTRTRGSDKLAKRRRITMGGGSTMSSPLILPLGSAGVGASVSMPGSPSSASSGLGFSAQYQQQQAQTQAQQQQQNQKSRKEQRRERKLMKRKSSGLHGGYASAPYGGGHTPHHGQAFHHHVHHHHHPNAKARSTSGTQRGNFYATGVPPLNL
ncbi:hypothetical protein JR316_0008269 [Psilocybe cubensis]|uniref:Uncharacterized protein n=2 Tax=Psilocybe cubensis TaxID=181762 RepID=A0ACB8GXD6_PSICU|nr:hypothetical protein JR316_0008269 [Psilocybe cubensis]KAH9479674.1 hypothetical protein JR316_0008269 [Psilocybe cubensis]